MILRSCLLLAALAALQASAFDLYRDTLHSQQSPTPLRWESDTLLVNRTGNAITIDSIQVRPLQMHWSLFELRFTLGGNRYTLAARGGQPRSDYRMPTALPARGVCLIEELRFAACLRSCPTPPTPGDGHVAVTYPMSAWVTFFSGASRDSAVVVGSQDGWERVVAVGTAPGRHMTTARFGSGRMFTVRGQRVVTRGPVHLVGIRGNAVPHVIINP